MNSKFKCWRCCDTGIRGGARGMTGLCECPAGFKLLKDAAREGKDK